MAWESDYKKILLQGRAQSMKTMPKAMRLSLGRIYVSQMDLVLAKFALEEMTEEGAKRFMVDLGAALVRMAAQSEVEVKRQILQLLRGVQATHRMAWNTAVGATGSGIHASFSGVPAEAFEALFQRRGLGLTQSYKTLTKRSALASAELVDDALNRMILQGESYTQATQRIAKAMATGDPYLEAVAKKHGSRGGLKRWVREAGIERDLQSSTVARKIGADAKRIALTEANMAYHEGDRIGSMRSPAIIGMRRNLSPRHPEPDICDVEAEADIYGLGPGVYPPETIITPPHPNCFCWNEFITRPVEEWDSPKPTPSSPRMVSQGEVRARMPKATDRAVETTTDKLNADVGSAYSFWNQAKAA